MGACIKFLTDVAMIPLWTYLNFQHILHHFLLGIRIPPSSLITTPLSIGFSIPSLTILANSSAFPGLSGNSITLVKLDLALSPINAVIPESNRLGATVTTLTPYLERSRVRGSVSDANAPFATNKRVSMFLVVCSLRSESHCTQIMQNLRLFFIVLGLHVFLALDVSFYDEDTKMEVNVRECTTHRPSTTPDQVVHQT